MGMTTITRRLALERNFYTNEVVVLATHRVVFDGDPQKKKYVASYDIPWERIEDLELEGGPDSVASFVSIVAQTAHNELETEEQLRLLEPVREGALFARRLVPFELAPVAVSEQAKALAAAAVAAMERAPTFETRSHRYVMQPRDDGQVTFVAHKK